MFKELFETQDKIMDMKSISLDDTLYIKSKKDNADNAEYIVRIDKLNNRTIEGTILKDFGPGDMIMISYRKKNFLSYFDVYTKKQKPEMFL
ncbi:MAG: hypothetical protein J7L15_01935 [Clostridiales bacterium]|nr:hypothetical protein [Clostridiales bacterium]